MLSPSLLMMSALLDGNLNLSNMFAFKPPLLALKNRHQNK
jgi:hypothetical protein